MYKNNRVLVTCVSLGEPYHEANVAYFVPTCQDLIVRIIVRNRIEI